MRTRAWLVVALGSWLLACEGDGAATGGQPDGGADVADVELTDVGFTDLADDRSEPPPEAPAEVVETPAEVVETPAEVVEAAAEVWEPPVEVVETSDGVGEEVGPSPDLPAGFGMRVASLTLTLPDLCYPSGQTCVPLNGLVDAALVSALEDAQAPLDLVGVFGEPIDGVTPFAFGAALCTHPSGAATQCQPAPDAPEAQALMDAHALAPEVCPAGYTGPCFQAGPADVLLDLPLFGGAFGLRQAVVMGVLDGVPAQAVEAGTIRGFLPRALAEKYQIGGVGADPVLVADVFPAQTEQLEGQAGWWVTLGYRGVRVDVVLGP